MKNKLLAVFLCFCALFFGISANAAEGDSSTVDDAKGIIDGIVAFQQNRSNVGSVREWIDGALANNAGIDSEWYILALSQSGDHDFSKYEAALCAYLEKNEVYSASSRQKYALVLSSIGSTEGYIYSVLEDSVGKQGIMSFVYGLHLLNNGYVCDEYAISEIIRSLTALQCEDGGWSLGGEHGEVDVTAMTVQALAPHYDTEASVKEAVDQALEFLSVRQIDGGGYESSGVSNPESAAQVMIALSSLGIDCEKDIRFVKNGNTLFDFIGDFRLPDGSFCHKEGDAYNETATVQVFCAMVSYLRMLNGKSPLYILDRSDPENVERDIDTLPIESDGAENITDQAEDNDGSQKEGGRVSYKIWACLIIIGCGAIFSLILYFSSKRHFKNFIVLFIVAALAVIFVCMTDFRTAEDYYNGDTVHKENVIGSVTLTIRCDTIAGKNDFEYIPSDGVILDVTEFDIEKGDTVYEILTEAAKRYHIQIENNGSEEMAYIVGISYIYELDFGDLSGWVYHVNGTSPSMGCGSYELSDGDVIEWLYTCDLGDDVK